MVFLKEKSPLVHSNWRFVIEQLDNIKNIRCNESEMNVGCRYKDQPQV